jgi:beta-ribofuranosylaminobenzene 5'-phosphate synthase
MLRNSFAATTAEKPKMGGENAVAAVEVFAPARLHLGFLDLDGALGRRYGSLGVAIDRFGTRLTLTRAKHSSAEGPGAGRALQYLNRAAVALALSADARVIVHDVSPEHAGFGSGTQLGLAVAAALARIGGLTLATPALAAAIGRGARSGIGIGAFDHGGFIVDGGIRNGAESPPVTVHLAFPAAWRILLILDPSRSGLYGDAERAAFAALSPFPDALAGRLCRLVLMSLLPGLAEADFGAVSRATGEIQARLGDYFSAAQNGRFSSPAVAEALAWISAQGVGGIGQSSWGPTGFALFESDAEARRMAERLRDQIGARGLALEIVAARNAGAEIAGRRAVKEARR